MKFSTPQSPESSSSTSHRRTPHRHRIPAQSSSYAEEIESSQFQESQTEDVLYGDDDDREGQEEADDGYEGEEEDDDEQSRTITNNHPYTESESVAKKLESSVRSSSSNNTVEASAISPHTHQITQTPQYSAYVNIAPLPMFRGEAGECPITHLSRFGRVCRANNAWSTDMMMRIFPVTLDGDAALWYELDIEPHPSLSWEEIKSSFVQTHRRTEFVDRLRSELMTMTQGNGELVNAFYLRMQSILKKWPDHGVPDLMLRGIFIDGLKEDYQDWVLPHSPNSLEEALRLALTWEQVQSIRAARQRMGDGPNKCNTVKCCGFCEGPHAEQTCEIRRNMKELWMRNKERPLISLSSFRPEKNFRSLSATTSLVQRQCEDGKEGDDLSGKKSQCQCWKHQCWKKNAIARSNSLLARNSTAD